MCIRDSIERGNTHAPDLTMVQETLRDGQGCRAMCDKYGIPRKFIEVKAQTHLVAVK